MYKRVVCAAALALAGCTMIPRYERPAAPVSAKFPGGSNRPANIEEIHWQSFFADPRLKRCVEIALQNNRDLRVAVLNVEKARAQYHIQRSSLFPTISGTGSYTRERFAGDTFATGGFGDVGSTASSPGFTTSEYGLSVGVTSYELDLFGHLRSGNRQALETYFAQAETRRSTHISLVAQVATQYLTWVEMQELVRLSQETLNSVQKSYDLTKKKVDVGASSDSDLASVDVEVQTARVNIHNYERLAAQAANALVELIGQPLPADLPAGRSLNQQGVLAEIPSGLPSDLIARRPDILAQEHTLLAANANIGAARAAFFPTITLTGSAGASSLQLSQLFTKAAEVWSFAPQITAPIFTGGKNLANLDVAKVSKRIEIANYEKTIQTAFREVSDALVARKSYTQQLEAQEALVRAQQKRFDLAQKKYESGAAGYLDVLTAQQDLYSAQQNLISTREARLENLVTLYKALGGGWDVAVSSSSPRISN